MNIAENLKKVRKKCGLTQTDIADSFGICRSTYTYWELGKSTPSYKDLIKLSRLFDVPVQTLLLGEEPEEATKRVVPPTHSLNEPLDDILGYLKKDEQLLLIAYRLLEEKDKDLALQILREFVEKKNGEEEDDDED